MPHYGNKKGNLVSQQFILDPETGVYDEFEKEITYQEMVVLKTKGNTFHLYHDRLDIIESPHLFYFLRKLAQFIEYQTGRLTISHDGKTPVLLKSNSLIGKHLGIDRKTVGENLKKLKKMNIVFKIEGALYINPTFIQYGKEFPTDLLEIMMQKDKTIRKYVPFKTARNMSYYKRVS